MHGRTARSRHGSRTTDSTTRRRSPRKTLRRSHRGSTPQGGDFERRDHVTQDRVPIRLQFPPRPGQARVAILTAPTEGAGRRETSAANSRWRVASSSVGAAGSAATRHDRSMASQMNTNTCAARQIFFLDPQPRAIRMKLIAEFQPSRIDPGGPSRPKCRKAGLTTRSPASSVEIRSRRARTGTRSVGGSNTSHDARPAATRDRMPRESRSARVDRTRRPTSSQRLRG